MSSRIGVAILDDHQSIIDGYCYRLEKDNNIEVVATGMFGEDLDEILSIPDLDVLILDLDSTLKCNRIVTEKIPRQVS